MEDREKQGNSSIDDVARKRILLPFPFANIINSGRGNVEGTIREIA